MRFENGDKAALGELYSQLDDLIKHILKEVMKQFKMYDKVLESELYQVGSAELIELVYRRGYDPNKGSFSSYIYPYLRAAMIIHIEQFITPAAIAHKDLLAISKCRKMHRDGMTDESIANELGVSRRLVARYLRFSFKTESLMLTLQDEYGEAYIGNPKLVSREPKPDSAAYVKICSERLKLLFDKLSPKQQMIIGSFFGAFGYEEMTIEEIADFELMTQDAVKKQKHEAMELLYYWYWHFSDLRKFREAWWAVREAARE